MKNIRERLRKYYEAETAILSGQSYSIEGLSLTRADLATVQSMIAKLENLILREAQRQTRSRIKFIVPCDALNQIRRRGVLR